MNVDWTVMIDIAPWITAFWSADGWRPIRSIVSSILGVVAKYILGLAYPALAVRASEGNRRVLSLANVEAGD
jgi:hypothetical protein